MKRGSAVPAEAIFALCCSLSFGACLIARADVCGEAVRGAVDLCLRTLIPSLFPFLVLNGVFLGAGGVSLAAGTLGGVFSRVFRVPASLCAPFFIGLTAGFPSGAAAVARVYLDGGCSKDDAERALAFSSNAGPAFAIGGIGAMLGGPRLGGLIWAAQVLSSVILALLIARIKPKRGEEPGRAAADPVSPPEPGVFVRAVKGAVYPMLCICAFVLVFAPVTALIGRGLEAAEVPVLPRAIILTAVELTNGAAFAASSLPAPLAAAVCAFGLSWSGLCVCAQTASCVSDAGLSLRYYLPGKLFTGIFSAALVLLALSP